MVTLSRTLVGREEFGTAPDVEGAIYLLLKKTTSGLPSTFTPTPTPGPITLCVCVCVCIQGCLTQADL